MTTGSPILRSLTHVQNSFSLEASLALRGSRMSFQHSVLTKLGFLWVYFIVRDGPLAAQCGLPPPYRAIPFRDSIAEGGIAPICFVFIGSRASIAGIPL